MGRIYYDDAKAAEMTGTPLMLDIQQLEDERDRARLGRGHGPPLRPVLG